MSSNLIVYHWNAPVSRRLGELSSLPEVQLDLENGASSAVRCVAGRRDIVCSSGSFMRAQDD